MTRVAGAVRQRRGDAVKLWPVPMRISREGTAEEADASARATRELVRLGGLSREQVERDMKGLLVKAEPNVPFMESRAPFNDTDAALDPLTANLARLTREITERDIEIPHIPDRWRDSVQMRLAPALSTEAYLRQLMNAEPVRAARELHRYVESALATLADGEALPKDYVRALVETNMAMQQRGDEEAGAESHDTGGRVNILLRKLYEQDQETWRPLLVEALQASLDAMSELYFPEDETVALEEIDELLADAPTTDPNLSRRAENRLRIAKSYASMSDPAQQLSAAEDALTHLGRARRLPNGDGEDMQVLRYEAMLQKAEALDALEQPEEAADTLRKIVKAIDHIVDVTGRSDAQRLSFEANHRLMRLARRRGSAAREASQYARAAAARAQPATILFLSHYADLAEAIVAGLDAGHGSLELLRRIAVGPSLSAAQFLGRGPKGAVGFIESTSRLLAAAKQEPEWIDDGPASTAAAAEIVVEVFVGATHRILIQTQRLMRSKRLRPQEPTAAQIADAVREFVQVAEASGGSASGSETFTRIRRELASFLRRAGMGDAAGETPTTGGADT